MLRELKVLADKTPPDYLAHVIPHPDVFALQLIEKASRLYPVVNRDDGIIRDPTYAFLIVGPGSGLVIQTLLDMGHRAYGIETSRRGIQAAPEEVRSYIAWCKPWESPHASMAGDPPVPIKRFHIGIINKFLKEYFTPEEWARAIDETKKTCKTVFTI